MRTFQERITENVVLGDGAWGTMLAERGLPPGSPPERWTLERPEVIADIARAYADAGAELITTNTFGGSPMRLAQHRLGDRFEEINRLAVEVVREAVAGRALVNASIGPSGRLLQPLGDAVPEEVRQGFALQAGLLLEAGADAICIETMTDLREAELAVRAVRSVSADIAIMAFMTFDLTPRGPFTVMGNSVVQAAKALTDAGATVVGANCGSGVEGMKAVAKAFLDCATVPVAIQPNAGLPERRDGALYFPESPERFAAGVAAIARMGVRMVGGCCGTTPEHIRALRAALSSRA